MGLHDRHRHELGRFAAGISNHGSLVSGSTGVDSLRNVRGLAANGLKAGAAFIVKTVVGMGIADVLDDLANEISDFDIAFGRDFAADNAEAYGNERFTGHAAHRVLLKDLVQNGIRNLITDFVWMTFGDGLGC